MIGVLEGFMLLQEMLFSSNIGAFFFSEDWTLNVSISDMYAQEPIMYPESPGFLQAPRGRSHRRQLMTKVSCLNPTS